MGGAKNMKNKQKTNTERLQKLVKKRKTPKVVIKAGSIKFINRNSNSSDTEYMPSSFYNT